MRERIKTKGEKRNARIKKKIARNTYILEHLDGNQERGQFHALDLKKYWRKPSIETKLKEEK